MYVQTSICHAVLKENLQYNYIEILLRSSIRLNFFRLLNRLRSSTCYIILLYQKQCCQLRFGQVLEFEPDLDLQSCAESAIILVIGCHVNCHLKKKFRLKKKIGWKKISAGKKNRLEKKIGWISAGNWKKNK